MRAATAALALLLATLGIGSGAPDDAPADAATGLRAMYASINAAAVDAYLASALADPRLTVGDAEPCLRTDNTVSSRPSPLASPPFPAAPIAQRTDLVRLLALYADVMSAMAVRGSATDAGTGEAELLQAVARAAADATAHEPHDLAIAPLVATLRAAVAPAAARPSADAAKRAVVAADPAFRGLIDVLTRDASSAHADALGAARSAYAAWTAAYERARRLALRGASGAARSAAALPRCASPAGAARAIPVPADAGGTTAAAIDPSAEIATFAMRSGVLARLDAANARYRALLSADPSAMLASLRSVDDALVDAARSPGPDGAAPALERTLATFRADARTFAEASAALAGPESRIR